MTHKKTSIINLKSSHQAIDSTTPFIFVVEKGKSIIEAVTQCAVKFKLKSAALCGIGALADPELGYYNTTTKLYQYKKFTGCYELVSLNGNITNLGDQFVAHIHVALSDNNYQLIAGHLKNAIVGVTVEMTIIPFPHVITRANDPDFNVPLITISSANP